MSFLVDFSPWIVYWILVGNVPFETAVLVALALAIAAFVAGRLRGAPGRTLAIGGVGTFAVLAGLTFTVNQAVTERWLQPLSNAGIFVVAVTGVLIGRPFVREFAAAEQPADPAGRELFDRITLLLTWAWVAAFAGMTVSSAIPALVQGDASIRDTDTPLSVICYWVVPYSLLGVAALLSKVLPDRMTTGGSGTPATAPPTD